MLAAPSAKHACVPVDVAFYSDIFKLTFHSLQPVVSLGRAIKRARSKVGLSQEALAVDANLDRSYVGGIERGEHNVTVMNVTKIAAALKTKTSGAHEQTRTATAV